MSLRARAAFFFFNDTATTEIYTLSLHDALPISRGEPSWWHRRGPDVDRQLRRRGWVRGVAHWWRGRLERRRDAAGQRSEEHTSELQSLAYLVCRLLLEKKNDCPENDQSLKLQSR